MGGRDGLGAPCVAFDYDTESDTLVTARQALDAPSSVSLQYIQNLGSMTFEPSSLLTNPLPEIDTGDRSG
jgi:hypothetical protein